MQQVLAVALGGMQEDMSRLDRIAQNMVNMATPGYKREVAASHPFVALVDGIGAAADGTLPADVAAGLTRPVVRVDTSAGSLKRTGQALDLALSGDAFFEVQTAQGPAYTRQGNFNVDGNGRLVTAAGDPVMGRGGEIHLGTRTPAIDGAGNITDPAAASPDGAPLAQLKVVRFDDVHGMQHLGAGLLSAGERPTTLTDATARVQQGQLEASNTNTMQEMVQMMQTMRHFESMQKVAQGYDDLVSIAITKLGDLS